MREDLGEDASRMAEAEVDHRRRPGRLECAVGHHGGGDADRPCVKTRIERIHEVLASPSWAAGSEASPGSRWRSPIA